MLVGSTGGRALTGACNSIESISKTESAVHMGRWPKAHAHIPISRGAIIWRPMQVDVEQRAKQPRPVAHAMIDPPHAH